MRKIVIKVVNAPRCFDGKFRAGDLVHVRDGIIIVSSDGSRIDFVRWGDLHQAVDPAWARNK